jgi:DNA-binding NarL/FixJ family response regulator
MRVLLTNLPPLLKGILSEALAGESDIAIVGATPSGDVASLVRQSAPDILLTQASRDDAARVAQSAGATVGVVAIDPDARHALVFAPGEAPIVLADVSPTTIIMAMRSIAERRSRSSS